MRSFRRLLARMGNYRGLVVLGIMSNIATAVFTVISIPLLIPFFNILFGQAESDSSLPEQVRSLEAAEQWLNAQFSILISERGREAALGYVCIFILASFLLKNLFRYLALFFLAPVRNGVIRDMRSDLYDKLLFLPLAYFSEERKGDLMARLTSDVQEVESSVLNVLEAVFREPLIIIGSLAFMLIVSPGLTGFVFGLMLFTGIVIGGIGKRLKRSSSAVQEKLGDIISLTEETLGGIRIVKGFAAEGYQQERFARENNTHRRLLTRLLWRRDLSSPLTEFLGIATVALLLWYGSRQVFAGVLDGSTFIAFIYAFYMVIDPAKNFSKAYYNIQRGIGALERVEHILHTPNPIQDPARPTPVSDFRSVIEYRGVSFRYPNRNEYVLSGIGLQIPKGKVVALVGASGAGKSTLVDLLPRFYDVSEGQICIDGTDIREFALDELRGLMGIVSQEAILFNDTIYNNIVFGMEGVTAAEVERAARVAHAHDFIMATEQGYQTNIGDRGMKLSGGQRQRLTIARAILRDPPILILDEATSALDSESEQLVQRALTELMRNRTAIVIAHRLSTIQYADEIIVLRHGRIVERGRHQELLSDAGEYRKLVELQGLES